MKSHTYDILSRILDLPVGSCPHIPLLLKRFPGLKPATLMSIYLQENQYKVIKSNHVHKGAIKDYVQRYLSGEDILELSANVDFPPCMLARRMLEYLLPGPKQIIGEVLKSPHILTESLCPDMPLDTIQRLQHDLLRCTYADCSYSPYSDIAKQTTGLEYEQLLHDLLKARGISCWTEAELRLQGYHKTPDAKLKVPIAVRNPATGRHRLLFWIDSKATFGDRRTHVKQMAEQYSTYVNRYGPGLVIYWFGFIEEMNTDHEVLLLDDFPDQKDVVCIV